MSELSQQERRQYLELLRHNFTRFFNSWSGGATAGSQEHRAAIQELKEMFPPRALADKEFAAELARELPWSFEHLPESLRHDRSFVLGLVGDIPNSFQQRARSRHASEYIRHSSDAIKGDREVMMYAAMSDGRVYEHVSDELKRDKDLLLHAFSSIMAGQINFLSIPETLRGDRDVALAAIAANPDNLKHLPKTLLEDRSFIMTAARTNGLILKDLPEPHKSDPNVIMTAMFSNGEALQYVHEHLRDRNTVLAAVHNTGKALQFAPAALRDDAGVVVAAVGSYGRALEHASLDLRQDPRIVHHAVQSDPFAIQFAAPELKSNAGLAMAAASRGGAQPLTYMDPKFLDDPRIMLAAIKAEPASLMRASERLLNDITFATSVVGIAPVTFDSFPAHIRKDPVLQDVYERARELHYPRGRQRGGHLHLPGSVDGFVVPTSAEGTGAPNFDPAVIQARLIEAGYNPDKVELDGNTARQAQQRDDPDKSISV